MAGDTFITFYGLWHLEGEDVTVSILGLDCGEFTVSAEGSIEVPYGSDAGELLTPQYLIDNSNSVSSVENNMTFNVYNGTTTASVTVPVTIGLGYTSQGQILRPNLASDLRSSFGHGLGKTRRGHMLAALVQDAVAIDFGTDFSSTLKPASFSSDGANVNAEDEPFSGVYQGLLADDYGFDSMLCWQVDRPYACTVSSVSIFLDFEER